nr:hypothetical protein [Tanacetum cinerariifolium]
MHSSRQEDGTLETMDPQDLLCSFLLADTDLITLDLLTGSVDLDFLELVDGLTPIEDNTGLLETRFEEKAVFMFVFPEDVTGSVNLTLLALFIGVTSTNLSRKLLMQGQ